jgi:hypothetical protein
MHIVVTHCSRKKQYPERLLVPALVRYAGRHIIHAQKLALELNAPLYFLSGQYGLVGADEPIIFYDYHLLAPTDALTQRVVERLRELGVTRVTYMTEGAPAYDETMRIACELAGADLHHADARPPDV